MRYWLLKNEEENYSIDDLRRDKITSWEGVRNYQARNFLRDEIKKGDAAIFYHSNGNPSGAAGVVRIMRSGYPDDTQFDKRSIYFDPKATKEDPRWYLVDVKFEKKFPSIIPLAEIKRNKKMNGALLLRKGDRLSVQPLTKKQFDAIISMSKKNE